MLCPGRVLTTACPAMHDRRQLAEASANLWASLSCCGVTCFWVISRQDIDDESALKQGLSGSMQGPNSASACTAWGLGGSLYASPVVRCPDHGADRCFQEIGLKAKSELGYLPHAL